MWDFFKRTENQNGRYTKPYYSIVSVHSDKVIDVAQDTQNQGTTILWEPWAGDNQMFTLKQKGPDYYLKCKKDKLYLTVEGDHDGARIYAAPKTKEPNQRFRIDQRQPGSKQYIIYTYCGKVLDCEGQGKDDGTRVLQWEYNGGDNQTWRFNDPKEITSSSSECD